MSFLVIVIDSPKDSIQNLNDKSQTPTKPEEAVNLLSNYLDGIKAGTIDASVQVTTRNTDPSVGTSGSGSTQYTYNLK